VPPTDSFHEHENDPVNDPPPNVLPDPGGTGGGSGPGGDDLSPTPEPGSMLLIGTGLIGILGALRRHRLL
jgi:hypothetical protein